MTIGSLQFHALEERPEAASLLSEWFVDDWPGYHRGRSLPDVASRFRLVPDVIETLVAELEDEVVGTVALRGSWEAAPEIPPPWLGGLYVVSEHRGEGIGMALVEAAVRLADARGYDAVHLAVRIDPASYLARSWRFVGTISFGEENVTVLSRDTR